MLLAAHGALKPLGPTNDPFWADVVFMQTFDGIANGTVLSDPLASLKAGSYSSTFASRYTVSSAQGRFGNSAQNTSGNFCSIAATISGNFTFEASGYYTSGTPTFLNVVSNFGTIGSIQLLSGNLYVSAGEGGTSYTGSALSTSTWYDAAVSWDGTSLRFFWNGALVHTSTKTNPATAFRMSFSSTANAVFTDDVRITAACRYTSAYTPSHPFIAS